MFQLPEFALGLKCLTALSTLITHKLKLLLRKVQVLVSANFSCTKMLHFISTD